MIVSIIIPVFNERDTIIKLLQIVQECKLWENHDKEIIVIDDFSEDGTRELLQSNAHLYDELVLLPSNKGKGEALKNGFSLFKGDLLIIQDADLEYDRHNYIKLVKPIMEGRADVVYGSRFIGGDSHRVVYFWHMVGNKFLTLLSNIFTNINLTDMECCYKVFHKNIAKKINIEEQRFGVEPELTAKISKLNCRIYEVGVSYYGRTYEEGKKIGIIDGFRALYCIVRYNLFR